MTMNQKKALYAFGSPDREATVNRFCTLAELENGGADVQRVVPVVVIQFIQRVHEPEEYGLGDDSFFIDFPADGFFLIQYAQTDFRQHGFVLWILGRLLRLCGHVTFHFVPVGSF